MLLDWSWGTWGLSLWFYSWTSGFSLVTESSSPRGGGSAPLCSATWGHFLQCLFQPVDSSYTIYLPLMLVDWPSSWMLPCGTCSAQPCASRVTKEVLMAQMIKKKKKKFYLQCKWVWKSLSHIWLLATPWTMAHQAPQSMGISQARILEWIAIPFSRDLLAPGIKPRSPALQADSYCRSHQGSPQFPGLGSISWVGKISWRREWQPIPVFLPGEFQGQRSLAGYSSWGSWL